MSSYYLCETCEKRIGTPKDRVCLYKYAYCTEHGEVRMPVMSDARERPTDLCVDYEPKCGEKRVGGVGPETPHQGS